MTRYVGADAQAYLARRSAEWRERRYSQCDATCTTDCGHCKGNHAEVLQARESAALTEHEAGVDAFVARPEFGGAR